MSKALTTHLYNIDPSLERSLKAKRLIESVMLPYIELQKKMRTKVLQTTITEFFNHRVPNPDAPEPVQPSTSGNTGSSHLSHCESEWSRFSDNE
ncbi:hypothetical protein Pmani_019154 [Petrolisthes manimaculis]|uniref:Uncharacterized protein n=1 Tax=Petrolisthes manimaculis TaxID=1843537 RepID=A0AAE1PKZ7_9EUCA|nr:hypothetical protein Pmani_019154 [Petrolisthes manimaculis]